MIRLAVAALLAALALAPTAASAWGAYGHRTIAAIALRNVTPLTRVRIAALLKSERQLGTPACRVRTLQDAAVWADCIKGESWRWAHTFPWHYQDQPICAAAAPAADCPFGTCVTAQIERNARILKDRALPQAQRLEALALLVHFVGDVHQPLHGADNGDQGGNGVKLAYGIAPRRNLHGIWDTALAERAISSAQPPLVRIYTPARRAELATGSARDWLRESWQIARTFVYPTAFAGRDPCAGDGPLPQPAWPDAAIEAAVPVVRERVEQAGLRLARMLDAALG